LTLRWVAREKSPIGSVEFTPPVWGLPLWESQAAGGLLTLLWGEERRWDLSGPERWPKEQKETLLMTSRTITELPSVVAEHIAAVNNFDLDGIVATFAPDAYVNDNRREIWGLEAIRNFMAKEFVGDHVTMEVRDVIDHYGDTIVRAKYDGDYDKTNLPEELVMSSYFAHRNGKIVSLAVIFNQRSPY
jgi:hypothetical protein